MNKPQVDPTHSQDFDQGILLDLLARLFLAENMAQVAYVFDCVPKRLLKRLIAINDDRLNG